MRRKIIVTFILLIIVAGVIAYFGTVNLGFSADTYGVVFTKTSGFEDSVVAPGRLIWSWKRLFPTNMTVYRFELRPRMLDANISGRLPGGELYAHYVEGNPSFSYELTLRLSYRLKPEALPSLVKTKHLRPEDLDKFYSGCEEQVKNSLKLAVEAILSSSGSADGGSAPTLLLPEDAVRKTLERDFSEIEFVEISIPRLNLPDLALYVRAKNQYLAVNAIREERTIATMKLLSEREVTETSKIELLTKYGELFTKYPALIDFFSIFKESARDFVPLP